MASDTTITHEPVDDIPVILDWLLTMHLDTVVDSILPPPHGNWQGLSYGQVTVIWLTCILSQSDHRLCPVEEWVGDRLGGLARLHRLVGDTARPERRPTGDRVGPARQ